MSDSGSSSSSLHQRRKRKKGKKQKPGFDINSIISNPVYTAGMAGVAVAGLMYFFGPSSKSRGNEELLKTRETLGKYENKFKELMTEKGEFLEVMERQQVSIRNLQEYIQSLEQKKQSIPSPPASPPPETLSRQEGDSQIFKEESPEDYINNQFEELLKEDDEDDFATPAPDKGKEDESTFFREEEGNGFY